jgi:hypothetical protein
MHEDVYVITRFIITNYGRNLHFSKTFTSLKTATHNIEVFFNFWRHQNFTGLSGFLVPVYSARRSAWLAAFHLSWLLTA